MNNQPQAVSEVPPNGAALVNYPEYRKKHPPIPNGREIARSADEPRVLILPPLGAALVDYAKYDLFILEPPALNETTEEIAKLVTTTGPAFEKKES